MPRERDVALCIAAALAAAYILAQWWRDDDTPPPPLRTHDLPPPLPRLDTSESTDTESLEDILSPAPTHDVLSRRSVRAHDLFAASHISFSELGSLVAPQDEH